MSHNNYILISNALILLVNYIDCVNLVPYRYNLSPLPDFGSGVVPYSLIYNPLILNSETDPLTNGQKSLGFVMPPPFVNTDDVDIESQKAYSCSLMPCMDNDDTPVCACNFKTGNVVSFKNSCDVKKHNCRFETEFRIILNEICPWEFQSRRTNKVLEIDYSDPKYYNR